MANLTYRELAEMIDGFSDEQKNCNVTVFTADDEFYPISVVEIVEGVDVLDDDHPVLIVVNESE